MGWLTKALSPEDPAAPIWPSSWFDEGMRGDSGIHVTEKSALRISAVLACVRVISETIGMLPLNVYQRLPQGKRLATEHPLYPILHDTPNPQMTDNVFRGAVTAQACLWGNGYSLIQRDGFNRARALWPLPSDRTKPVRRDGTLLYESSATPDGSLKVYRPEDILHLPFLNFDGLQGFSPIQLQQQGLGMSSAAERFGAMLFGKGARPSGVLETTEALKKEQRDDLRQAMQEGMSGGNALGIALMPPGVSFKPLTINPNDAQFLQTRKFQLEEIARWYRMQPHMIGILERATHSNIEQQSIEFRMYTMLPWVVLWEKEINRKLFAGSNFYAKFDMDELQRGDFASRTAGYQILRNIGAISSNTIADKEGWDRIPEDQGGDMLIVPMNFVSLEWMKKQENTLEVDPPKTENEGQEDDTVDGMGDQEEMRARYAMSFTRLFHDATGRTINKEKRDVAFVQRVWNPVLTTLANSIAALKGKQEIQEEVVSFLRGYVETLAVRCVEWQKGERETIATSEFNRAYTALTGKV